MNKIITSRGIIDLTIPADAKTDSAGEYYMICPICTADRKHTHQSDRKLAINLRKDPMPWRCNHCGEGGYIINEEYMKNAKFKPVLKSFDYLPLSDGLTNWFWKKRGISIPTLEAFKISMTIEPMKQYRVPAGQEELKDTWLSQKCINFKYFKDNVLINIKYRDPNKNFKMITDATKTIYNIDSFKGKKKGIIVEGEIDVLSYYEAGLGKEYGIGSVPNGATITKAEKEYFDKTGVLEIKSEINLEYLDSVIDELSEIEIFYIATDDDAPGIKLREELARRLGKERCRYIRFSNFLDSNGKPIKDANELLVAKGPNVLASTIDSSIPFPIAGVSVANDFWDSLNNYYDTGRAKGISTGFPSLDPHFNWMKGWMYILNGFPNNGKALDINTDIPTPSGFKKMKDLKIGDKVYDETGMPCNVTFATEIMHDRPCYEIEFSGHSKIKCDEEHLWFVYDQEARNSRARHLRKKPRTSSTTGISQEHLMIQPKVVTTKYIYENQKSKDSNKNNFSVDCCMPIYNPEKNLPIDPYILGLWLGDGVANGSVMTIGDEDATEILKAFEKTEYKVVPRKAKYLYGIRGLFMPLRIHSLLKNKHIPGIYLNSSIEQRLELLRGILDTDGYVSSNGIIELSLSDEKLALDSLALISSLGIDANMTRNKSFLNGENKKDRFRITFYTGMKVFKLKRKVAKLRQNTKLRHTYRTILSCKKIDSIPVKCIQVDSPNKLYLASRHYIPTHNTSVALNLIAISTVLYKWKWGIYCPENYPEENLIDMFAEILVGKSLDPGIVGRMSKIEYKAVVQEHISKYFYIVNDNDAGYSPADLRKIKKSLIKQYGITGFFTDPWSSLVHNYRSQDSEDKYLEHELSQEVRFTTKSGLINVISHHPKTPASVDKAPTVFSLTGGKVWWIKAYSIFAVHRKNMSDWQNLVTEFHVQKNKDFKAAGELTNDLTPPTFTYNRNNRRFYGQSPSDLQKHDFYPFKSYHETNQSVFEGF